MRAKLSKSETSFGSRSQAGTLQRRFTLGSRQKRVIFHGNRFGSRSETSVASRLIIHKATSEWHAKIFLCLLPFLRNRSCACAAKLIRKSQRRSTKTNSTPPL